MSKKSPIISSSRDSHETLQVSSPKSPNGDAVTPNPTEYPSTGKLWLIMSSLYITMFLVALDKTIIATAIPRITDAFHSLSSIGWYGSSYMLTLCAFQLLWGRIYTFYSPKPVFLTAILVFEIGSAICGAAPNSVAFIFGRAVAGLGSAGMMNGSIVITMVTVPLEKRPMFQGLIGAVFGVASVVGPLLGGVFTESVSWRWCFYINLPCGALVVAILVFFLRLPDRKEEHVPLLEQFKKLDPLGLVAFVPSVVCLLVALQWGGTTYAWSDWRIIVLLTLFPILFLIFIAIQILRPETATLPMRILTQRTVAFAFLNTFTVQSSMLVIVYFIPIFFQALKNFSPIHSGYAALPSILALVIGIIFAGGMVQKLGYPAPFMILSATLASIGAGLISTWEIDAARSMWMGYQVLFGFGVGIGMQQPSLCAQIVLSPADGPTGVSLMFFGQNLGGAIFLSAAQNVFTDAFARKLSAIPELGLTKQAVVEMGATKIRNAVPEELLEAVLEAYRLAIRNAFYVGLALACFSIVGALGVEWRSVKERKGKEGDEESKGEAQSTEKVVI